MSRSHRSAFTLVELLVVVVIIGMLAALLLPAVNSAREAARRTRCMNNQGELAKAILQYETQKQEFPGYVNGNLVAVATNRVRISWVASILEYIDRADLWKQWRTATAADFSDPVARGRLIAQLALSTCPSNTNADAYTVQTADASGNVKNVPVTLNYVVNCGIPDRNPSNPGQANPIPENKAYGIFYYHYNQANPITVKSTDIKDGGSETLLLSENLQSTIWNPNAADPIEWTLGMVWYPNAELPSLPWTGIKINDNRLVGTGPTVPAAFARPSSNHPGCVVAMFADAHGQIINDDIDYSVYQKMMAPDDATAIRNGLILP